jgi:predicted metal-binding membrane protein
MADENARFDHLDGPGQLAALAAMRPRAIVNVVVGAAVLMSWAAIAAMAIGTAQFGLPAVPAPGDWLLRWLPQLPVPDRAGRFLALCLTPAAISASPVASFLFVWLMWTLMALAMMLPSAAPMIRIYCEIADTARAKGEAAVHPLILIAGYLMVWVGASAAFAGVSVLVQSRTGASVTDYAAVAALGIAGLYQFSGLKEACLKKCRSPFAILFSRWSSRPLPILRLGAEQGVWCLGCCWALMLVMFAVGTMNIFWMALIGLFAVVEKQTSGRSATRLAGAILLVWAAALLVVSR